MRLIIVPIDGFVSVDGEGYNGFDLSFMDAAIHAVQWYGERGEIELKDVATGKIIENRSITSIDDFQPAVLLWQARKAQAE